MQITTVLLFVVCMAASAKVKSQITLSEKDAPLQEIFAKIEKQSGYTFAYTDVQMAIAQKVSIQVKDGSLEQVLKICFASQPFSYTIVEKTIVIKPKEASTSSAQNNLQSFIPPLPIDIKGRITNENGEPVLASILVKGTQEGTTSNTDGYFELTGVNENAVLIVSGVSIETFEVKVNSKTNFALTAKNKVDKIQEVIVRKGYYDEKRITTTGDVSTVTAKDIARQPVSNPLLALQGRVTGTQVIQSTGLPGTSIRLQIRGQNSIANGNEPLYIIDGVPYASLNLFSVVEFALGNSSSSGKFSTGSPFSYLNPADIESIDILKDADATAIYGSRGANGVVLITTKKGKQGKLRMDVTVQTGFGKVARKLNVLNTRQYLDMRYEAFKNDGAVPNRNADYDITLWDTTKYTDWQKELIGGTAMYNDVQAAFSGGSENIQYRIGAGYHKETTVFPGDFADQKASVQFNLNGQSANKRFQLLFSGIYTNDNNRLSSYDFTDQAIKLAPNAPALYNPDGSINWAPNANGVSTWNFAQPISMTLNRFRSKTNNLISNSTFSYNLFKGFDIKSNFGYNIVQTNDTQVNPQAANDPSTWSVKPRTSVFVNNKIESWIIEPQFSYTTKFGKGSINALLGTTFQQRLSTSQQLIATGFNSDLVLENIGAATNVTAYPGVNANYKYNAFFGRVNYNRNDQYIINLTGRRDGSSRFGPANQFHNFGAVGAAWIFSKEKFFERFTNSVNFGKLRFSYGTTGNDEIGDYSFMDIYATDPVGVPYQGAQGIRPNRIFTPDLAWEETKKIEGGIDLGFFNERLNLGVSYYCNRSSNQLIDYALPSITGFTTINKNLNALVQNSGLEIELRSVNISNKNFQWTSFLNVSANRNKLISVSDGVSQYLKDKVGMPISSLFVYKYLGVDFLSGLYQVADENGNVTATPKSTDAKTAINYLVPKFSGGFQNNFTWKGFQIDFLIQFVYKINLKGYLYNYIPGFFGPYYGSNQPVTILNHWQKPGDVAPVQKFSENFSTVTTYSNASNSDQTYKDISYARLKNVSVSWELPKTWKQNVHLQAAKLFVQGQNLFTVTNYKGLDPETCFGESMHLPPLRVITFGVQLSL